MNGMTEIFEAVNGKAELFLDWMRSHPRCALLFVAVLLSFWLTGMLLRWKWALHWQNYGKMWIFDDCNPEIRRRIGIAVVCIALMADLLLLIVWR